MTYTAVNDAPANSVPGAQTTLLNTALVFSTGSGNLISISDVDAGTVQVSLTATNGTVTLAGIGGLTFTTGDGTADVAMTFTGTVASINTAMDGMSFGPTAAYTGGASLQIITNDQGNTGTGGPLGDTDAVTITVNATNTTPTATNLNAAENYTEDILLDLTDIVVTDAESANVTATLTLSDAAAGSLSTGTSGAVTSTFVGGVWTASGAIADVNTLLAGVTFTPALDYNSNFNIATSVDDGIAAAITGTKAMTGTAVNDAPTATNLSAPESYTEDTVLNLTDIVVSDADSSIVTVTLTLSDVAAGSLNTDTSGAVTSTFVGGVWTASGAIADVNTLLAGVTFTPALDYNSNFNIATSVDDGIAAAITGAKVMTGTAVDDASVLAVDNNPVNEDNNATGNVLTNDSDVDDTLTVASFQVNGDAATYGAGNLATIAGVGNIVINTDGSYTFTPVADWNGSVPQVTYTTNTGSNSTLDITVTAVDDAPPPTLPVDDNDPDPITPPEPEPEPETPPEEPTTVEPEEEASPEDDALNEEDSGATVTEAPPANTSTGAIASQQRIVSNALRGFMQRNLRSMNLEQGEDIELNEQRAGAAETQQPAWSVAQVRTVSQSFSTRLTELGIQAVRALDFLENSLDGLKEEAEGEIELNKVAASSAIAVTTGLSVGYVAWLLRSGVLLSSLLSSMPAWRILDPLPVLAGRMDDFDETDEESLESIIEQPSPPSADDDPEDASASADVKET